MEHTGGIAGMCLKLAQTRQYWHYHLQGGGLNKYKVGNLFAHVPILGQD
jgi:hypothetical protein